MSQVVISRFIRWSELGLFVVRLNYTSFSIWPNNRGSLVAVTFTGLFENVRELDHS